MGCDITLFVEYKDRKNKKWVQFKRPDILCSYCDFGDKEEDCIYCRDSEVNISRNYGLFTILAGVRDIGKMEPISKPRGLPKDISDEVNDLFNYGRDDHSHSFLSYAELKKYKWKYKFDDFSDKLMPQLKKLALSKGNKNVRIVFGFDN